MEIFKENLGQGKYRHVHAERYGYTLALLRFKQYDAARNEIAKLLRQDPDSVAYRILQCGVVGLVLHRLFQQHPGFLCMANLE